MKITAKFKALITEAKKDGFNYVTVSRTQKWNTQALVAYQIDGLLEDVIGTTYRVRDHRLGTFRKLEKDEIMYQRLFSKYSKILQNTQNAI